MFVPRRVHFVCAQFVFAWRMQKQLLVPQLVLSPTSSTQSPSNNFTQPTTTKTHHATKSLNIKLGAKFNSLTHTTNARTPDGKSIIMRDTGTSYAHARWVFMLALCIVTWVYKNEPIARHNAASNAARVLPLRCVSQVLLYV